MYLHKMHSTHGRLVAKPEQPLTQEEHFDDNLTIQDQIENLRTKIGLKERYTKVLAEEFEESRQGASSILKDLYAETRELRLSLIAALNSENQAVQNALRTHQKFQLAMKDRGAEIAVPWLEDQLFDTTKRFNEMLHRLQRKRKKLEDAESMIKMIEKWPRPGTLPWEIEALERFHRIETQIENARIKKETAFILNDKYYEIKYILRKEKGKYGPTLRLLENQLRIQRSEVQSLNKMLKEANLFRDDAYKNLLLTEKEASENRKVRRKQMSKMKKNVDMILSENHASINMPQVQVRPLNYTDDNIYDDQSVKLLKITETLRQRRQVVSEFEERSKRLVESMRVHNLTEIPKRYRVVRLLAKQLKEEKTIEETIRDGLIKQRNHLLLILSHFKYTGAKLENELDERSNKYDAALKSTHSDLEDAQLKLHEHGDIMVYLRLSIMATLAKMEEGAPRKLRDADLKSHLKNLYNKVQKLIKEVAEYEAKLGDKEPQADKYFAKPTAMSLKLVRVGGPIVSDESEGDDDDLPDSHVPGRLDIKAKGQRIKQQAILRRGLK